MYRIIIYLDSYLSDINSLIALIVGLVASSLFFSFVINGLHNYIKYLVLYKCGDTSIKAKGYLSLRPKKGFHIIGFFSSLVLNMGFARPVKIKEPRLNSPKLNIFFMCLAGSGVYFFTSLFVFILYSLFKALNIFGVSSVFVPPADTQWYVYAYYAFFAFLYYTVFTTMSSAVISIIPVVPCDFGDFLFSFLPRNIKELLYKNEVLTGFFVFVLLFLTIGAPDGAVQSLANDILVGIREYFYELVGIAEV